MNKLTKEEKDYILSLIDRNTEAISHLEGAISDDGMDLWNLWYG